MPDEESQTSRELIQIWTNHPSSLSQHGNRQIFSQHLVGGKAMLFKDMKYVLAAPMAQISRNHLILLATLHAETERSRVSFSYNFSHWISVFHVNLSAKAQSLLLCTGFSTIFCWTSPHFWWNYQVFSDMKNRRSMIPNLCMQKWHVFTRNSNGPWVLVNPVTPGSPSSTGTSTWSCPWRSPTSTRRRSVPSWKSMALVAGCVALKLVHYPSLESLAHIEYTICVLCMCIDFYIYIYI